MTIIVQKRTMSKNDLTDHLYELAAYAKARGYEDACKWIMRHMARAERASRAQRKRKYHVGNRSGVVRLGKDAEVWIDPASDAGRQIAEKLKEAEDE